MENNVSTNNEVTTVKSKKGLAIGLGIVAAVAAIVGGAFLLKNRKNDEDDTDYVLDEDDYEEVDSTDED